MYNKEFLMSLQSMDSQFLKLVSKIDTQTENKQFVDLLIRGLKKPFSYLRTALKDAGYDEIKQLQSYIRAMDTWQESSDQTIIKLKENFEQSPFSSKTKDELKQLLQEKKKPILDTVSDLRLLYEIDTVAQQAGVGSEGVRNIYQSEYNKNIDDIMLINQWMNTLGKLTEHILPLSTILQKQINALRRDSTHPLAAQLSKTKTTLSKSINDMKAQWSVSVVWLETIQKVVKKTSYLLTNYHYVNGWSAMSMSNTDKQLLAYMQSMWEVVMAYRKEQVGKWKDTMMADRTQHLLRLHYQMKKWIVVDWLPSREKIVEEMHEKLMNRQNIVLTGPAWTWKTELAKHVQRQMIDDMHISGQIDKEEYQMLHDDLPYLSWNPDATKSELRWKRVAANKAKNDTQMIDELQKEKQDNQLFDYAYSKLELSIKYGIPIIIDEFLRYPESLLAYLKFFWSRKPWEKMTLSNGEQIIIRTVNFIATTNEWEQYGLYAKDFINREYASIKVDYLKDEELSDLIRAKMLHTPWYIPYISEEFFGPQWAVHRLIEVSKEISALRFNAKEQAFFSWKLNSAWQFTENTKGKLQSAVLDTKRLLQCFDLSTNDILVYWPTGALARTICDFIVSSSSYDNDKYLLIHLFSKKWLIGSSHVDRQSHVDYLIEKDPQAMHLTDNDGVSIIMKNMAAENNNDTLKWAKIWLTTIPSLTQSSLYGIEIENLPLSSDNPRLYEKRQFIKWLKVHYWDNDTINDYIDILVWLSDITDNDVLWLADVLINALPGNSIQEQTAWIQQLPDLKSLFDDETFHDAYIQKKQKTITMLQEQISIDDIRKALAEQIDALKSLLSLIKEEKSGELQSLIDEADFLFRVSSNKDSLIAIAQTVRQKIDELNKNMNTVDVWIDTTTEWWKRKTEAIAFLAANDMDTPDNRALINAVKFTPDAIEIGWVRWSYNNLQASDIGMNYSTDTKAQPKNYEEAHVFKWEWKFAQEDYFTRKAIDTLPANKKAKIPTYKDMRKTLAAIPWWPVGQAVPTSESSTSRTKWSAKILSILLWTKMSGYRRAGERNNTTKNGYLWSISPYDTNHAWAFIRDSSEGRLGNYDKRSAFPCRPLA
jgi:MoxR-like ATPase